MLFKADGPMSKCETQKDWEEVPRPQGLFPPYPRRLTGGGQGAYAKSLRHSSHSSAAAGLNPIAYNGEYGSYHQATASFPISGPAGRGWLRGNKEAETDNNNSSNNNNNKAAEKWRVVCSECVCAGGGG